MMKHTKRTREFPHQTEQEEDDSPLSEESISGSEDEGLARHVWDSYTNSQSQLNLIKEKVLEKVASPRLPLTPGNKKTADTKHVEVTRVEGTKGLKKSSGENHGTDTCLETEDPESLVTMIGRVFGSKVNFNLVMLLLFVCFLLYLVLLVMTIKAGSCADKLEELAELARRQREEWLEKMKKH